MCLYHSVRGTVNLKKKFGSKGYIIAYKELEFNGLKFVSPVKKTRIKLDKNGFFKSNRGQNKPLPNAQGFGVYHGIHVYLRNVRPSSYNRLVVKIKCYKNDLISAGNDNRYRNRTTQAVFQKIQFNKSELDSAKRQFKINIIKENIKNQEDTIRRQYQAIANAVKDIDRSKIIVAKLQEKLKNVTKTAK